MQPHTQEKDCLQGTFLTFLQGMNGWTRSETWGRLSWIHPSEAYKLVVVHIHEGIWLSYICGTYTQDKEVAVHIHKGIWLSYKNECIWVSSNEVDEPRAYYTEWSESEREKQISYTNAYIQNLGRWYQRIYFQGSNGETDIENWLMDMGRGEERVRCMERVTWKRTLPYVK